MSNTLTLYLAPVDNSRQYRWFDGEHSSVIDAAELPRLASGYTYVDVVVPGEDVLLLSADLPGKNRARMIQAMPYAVEDMLAEDVDRYHFSLGQQLADSRYQIAAVNRQVMALWMSQLESLGISARKLVPDMLCLPLADDRMTIAVDGDRAMVRTSPADGYVIGTEEVAVVCSMEPVEKSVDVLMATDLSSDVAATDADTAAIAEMADALKSSGRQVTVRRGSDLIGKLFGPGSVANVELNMMSGEFRRNAAHSGKSRGVWRWSAVLLVLAGGAELTSRGIQLYQVNQELDSVFDQQVAIVQQTFPEISSIQFPREQMEQAFNQQGGSGSGIGFLGILNNIGSSLSAHRTVRLGGMRYQDNAVVLKLSAPDLAAIDTLRDAIVQSGGVEVSLDSAVTLADSATADMRVSAL